MSGQLRRSGRQRGPPILPSPSIAAAARRRVASLLRNICTCVPAPTVNSPNASPASNSMTSNAPSSVDMSLGNVSSNPSTTTTIIIHSSKTDQNGFSVAITLQKQPNLEICPDVLTGFYLAVRPPIIDPFFIHFNGKSLTRYQFVWVLKKALRLIGIDSSRFSSHSFRIGCATVCQ